MADAPLYVSAVEGKPVTRYGTRTMIGATRSAAAPDVIQYDTKTVVPIPAEEYRKYRREYDRAIANGSLHQRSEKDWKAFQGEERQRQEQQRKAKDEAKAKAEADAKAAAAAEPATQQE